MKQNVAYLRVSTEAQTEKFGLDVQREEILKYCQKEGVVIDRWYIDGGYSGSKLDRPEVQELLEDAEKGKVGNVYIYKLDRMSRDVIDTLNLLYRVLPQYNVALVSVTEEIRTDTPMNKVMVTMNAAMNQYEREVIYMRTRAGMKERVKKGLWMGGGRVPFGYYYDRNDGILHPDDKQAEIVRQAYKLYVEGYSCDKIAELLDFKGDKIVIQILKRKSNLGYIEYKGETYKGLHEPIVSEELFYQAQECMKKRHTNSHINNDNILTGLCYCGVCGARMRYQKWGKYHKITCYSQYKNKPYMVRDPNCNNKKVMASTIESEVESCFRNFIINVDKNTAKENNIEIVRNSIQKSNSKIKKFYNLYAENDNENLLELIKEEEEKVKGLKRQLEEEIQKEKKMGKNNLEKIRRGSDVWDELSNNEKNKILKDCIEKIVITGDDIEIRFITF